MNADHIKAPFARASSPGGFRQAARTTSRKSWLRTAGPTGGTCGAEWVHGSGCRVAHCGHPTALRPYLGFAPDGAIVKRANGQAFSKLAEAQAAVIAYHHWLLTRL